jgi:type II secretory pathway component PulF
VWFLAFLVADLPVDTAVGLIATMPTLERALTDTELAMPDSTLWLIGLGRLLAAKWWLLLPPIAVAPFLVAGLCRNAAVRPLQLAFAVEVVLFITLCLTLLLPIHTIVQASG